MKQILFFLGLLLAIFTSSAQNADKFTGSLLWKVSGNGLDKPSYILGTHHLASNSVLDNITGFKNAIDEVEQVAGEIVMNDMVTLQTKVQQAAIMPADQTYKTLLSEEEYAQLDQGLTKMIGAGLEQLGSLKPGMLSSLYTITLYARLQPGFNPMAHEAIDQYVQKYAAQNNKPVIGLETVEDQIYALYDAEPLVDQAKSLACVANHPDYTKESLLALNKYYDEGKLQEMYDLAYNNPNDPCPSDSFMDTLNKDRNDKWLIKLPGIMKDKSTLIAVGALHLAGEKGILYQLDKMGYTIEAVK
jgi:uncharacterized protein YbaP (TraB family)